MNYPMQKDSWSYFGLRMYKGNKEMISYTGFFPPQIGVLYSIKQGLVNGVFFMT